MTAQLIFTITSWDNCIGLIACTKSCLQLRIHSSVARKLCVFEVNTLYSELWCSKNNAAIPFCLTDFCVVFFLFFLDFCWCWENRIKQWQKNIFFMLYLFQVIINIGSLFPTNGEILSPLKSQTLCCQDINYLSPGQCSSGWISFFILFMQWSCTL